MRILSVWLICLFSCGSPLESQANSESYLSLSGSYVRAHEHPHVFLKSVDVKDIVRRVNKIDSFSFVTFSAMTGQVANDLKAKVDWQAAYSGCDIDVYLHAMSLETSGGYADESRDNRQLKRAMNIDGPMAAPAGAAIVAARLALYAVLVKEGARIGVGAPDPDKAIAISKQILLAWAKNGFRRTDGTFVNSAEEFCDGQGKFDRFKQNGVGLQIARGVIYSVHAQDLLLSIGAFDPKETIALDDYHRNMYDLILHASNFRFKLPELNKPEKICELYSNHVAAHLTALLAIASLLNDHHKIDAVIYGRADSVSVPLLSWFNRAIYGFSDSPLSCYRNTGVDGYSSRPSFQTNEVAPGEIDDRYRNANSHQAFNYALGVLESLYKMATILSNSGYNFLTYKGMHDQSIELSTKYYACYGRYVGYGKKVTADNAKSCSNVDQYVGKIVENLPKVIIFGAYRFPRNAEITELEKSAKAAATIDLLDPIGFGLWND